MSDNSPLPQSDILIYQTEDGRTRIDVRLENESVWLSLNQMAVLFQRDKSVISRHINNIYKERELRRESTVAKYATVQTEGTRQVARQMDFYNLDVIISVGYRVRSHRGTQFRMWATQRLRDYIIKGFSLDDERFKQAGGGGYFDELLARIRDIRSSEKVFWRKVLAIYATSVDYDPNTEMSHHFFSVVQNKMHWAVHGHTAAEIVAGRADATKANMGLTAWAGGKPRKAGAEIAKNYLTEQELDALNRIVTIYLEFAELQALNRKPMYMQDWIAKLDEFLRISDREILAHAGKISHDDAIEKARVEFEKYRELHLNDVTPVEHHFERATARMKRLEKQRSISDRKEQTK